MAQFRSFAIIAAKRTSCSGLCKDFRTLKKKPNRAQEPSYFFTRVKNSCSNFKSYYLEYFARYTNLRALIKQQILVNANFRWIHRSIIIWSSCPAVISRNNCKYMKVTERKVKSIWQFISFKFHWQSSIWIIISL